jgi:hypothetical protein
MTSNMMQLAATAHQVEIRRAAAAQQLRLSNAGDVGPRSHGIALVVMRVLHTRAARRTQHGTVIPRVSI